MTMMRFRGNPILKPQILNSWESRFVFNAGILHDDEGEVHILYRAMGEDRISRIGYASSSDGYTIGERLDYPVFEPSVPYEKYGCEDPRLTQIDRRCFMAYTAYTDNRLGAFQTGITDVTIDDLQKKLWRWGKRHFPFPGIRNKSATLLPRKIHDKYMLFHRIEPDICVAYSNDLEHWTDMKAIMGPRLEKWDNFKVGCTGPPIEVNEGWLFIYHGVDFERVYRLGVVLLEKENPENIIYRREEPILEPEEDYEKYGNVPNVVYSCGNALIDDKLFVYYSGADTVLCLATYELNELLP